MPRYEIRWGRAGSAASEFVCCYAIARPGSHRAQQAPGGRAGGRLLEKRCLGQTGGMPSPCIWYDFFPPS
jgi:hypothetical protein